MRDTSSRSYAYALLTSCLLAACADGADIDVGQTRENLSGLGAVFWQPAGHELLTEISYCFRDDDADADTRALVSNALAETWSSVANIRFRDEGGCANTQRAAQAVHLTSSPFDDFGQTAPIGTPLRGGSLGHAMISYLPKPGGCTELLGFARCAQASVVHEFAHVLGFGHESARSDFKSDCPAMHPAPPENTDFLATDTLITPPDQDSVTDYGYCRLRDMNPLLSEQDIAGVRAIYGGPDTFVHSTVTGQSNFVAALRFHRDQPAPGESNALYLSAADSGDASWRSLIDHPEHLRLVPLDERPDSLVRYGDMLGIADEKGRFLSARDDGQLTFVDNLDVWEQWVVETIDSSRYPYENPVPVNAPVRFTNPSHRAGFTVESNGELRLTTDRLSSVWRINGPFTKD